MLAVVNVDIQMLSYLWKDLYYLWDLEDLDRLIDYMYQTDFLDALDVVLNSKAFRNIILALPFEEQIF